MSPIGGVRAGYLSAGKDAIPDSEVDNFEDANANPVGPYATGNDISTYYGGDIGSFGRTTSSAPENSTALENTSASVDIIHSVDGDGLPRYPQQGQRFSCLMRENGAATAYLFGVSVDGHGDVSGYAFSTNGQENEIRLYRYDNGSNTQISSTSASYNKSTWYEWEVEWQSDDTIIGRLFNFDTSNLSRGTEIASTQTKDANYSNNVGIGFVTRGPASAGTAWDYYRVLDSL